MIQYGSISGLSQPVYDVADGWCDLPGLQRRVFLTEVISKRVDIDLSEGFMDGDRIHAVSGLPAEWLSHSGKISLHRMIRTFTERNSMPGNAVFAG